MLYKFRKIITISLGILGGLFIVFALFISISMTKNSDIHFEHNNGYDASYVVDLQCKSGNYTITSNHLDTVRNGYVTRTKHSHLNLFDDVIVFCEYYYLHTDINKICIKLEEKAK